MAFLSIPCPFCEHEQTHIFDAVWDNYFKTVRRYRACPKCDFKWSTIEVDHDQAQNLNRKSLPPWRDGEPKGS